MKVAIKYGSFSGGPAVDAQGRLVGHEAVTTLARRLLTVFPGASIIGPAARRCQGFDMVPLEFVDAGDTLVINMDVIDSIAVWQTLHSSGAEPKLMNFAWQNPSHFHHRINFAAMGLSFALFPTFCNSERTAGEVREVIQQWVRPPLANASRIAWANLGVDIERVQPRTQSDVPVVLYPAIYVSERKQPQVFLDIVERVAKKIPLRVEARLHETHLVSEFAMKLSRRKWAWVGPLTATKEGYWQALAGTTAFLATAHEESYGLQYVEAMLSGVIGVYPDKPWAHNILPEQYPLMYSTPAQAEAMLSRAITDTEGCRRELDLCVGGDFAAWVRDAHNDDDFERDIAARVAIWFGA